MKLVGVDENRVRDARNRLRSGRYDRADLRPLFAAVITEEILRDVDLRERMLTGRIDRCEICDPDDIRNPHDHP